MGDLQDSVLYICNTVPQDILSGLWNCGKCESSLLYLYALK